MIMTSTVLPILCLMDWNSPKCRLNAPPPRFAPNYDVNKARAHDLARNRAKSAIRGSESDAIAATTSPPLKDLRPLEVPSSDYTNGFFTPILPSAATAPRRAVHSKATMATTTGPPRVVYLSDYDADYEASADVQQAPVTKPLEHTTTRTVTVLPRPYESVREAAKENPDYLGDSIWASVDLLPEPMVTGPAWRTHLTRNATRSTAAMTSPTMVKTSTRAPAAVWKTPPTTRRVPKLQKTTPFYA
ncbi:hypothetical protein OSTOST_05598, partial [Ostertagia ostertagi]